MLPPEPIQAFANSIRIHRLSLSICTLGFFKIQQVWIWDMLFDDTSYIESLQLNFFFLSFHWELHIYVCISLRCIFEVILFFCFVPFLKYIFTGSSINIKWTCKLTFCCYSTHWTKTIQIESLKFNFKIKITLSWLDCSFWFHCFWQYGKKVVLKPVFTNMSQGSV